MKTRNVTTILLCAGLLVSAFSLAGADEKSAPEGRGGKGKQPGFTVGGIMGGVLGGTVLIGGTSVEITDETRIYKVGAGALEPGSAVPSSFVLISGDQRNGKLYATMVMVAQPMSGRDFSQTTLSNVVMPKSAPR